MRRNTPLKPIKKLGQHFLVDNAVRDKIISHSGFSKTDAVLEIGPGRGALTRPLCKRVRRVVAVEKDGTLADYLAQNLAGEGLGNGVVLHQDILRTRWSTLRPFFDQKIQVMGNLPYNIATPILEWLIMHRARIRKAVLMFQLEVARRLMAQPGNKAYGALTVLVRYHAEVTGLFKVLKGSFNPVPGVDSMVVSADFERPFQERAVHEGSFKRVVKGAFAYRRKTIYNSLKRFLCLENGETLLNALETSGIDARGRAEILAPADFLRLTEALIDKKITI